MIYNFDQVSITYIKSYPSNKRQVVNFNGVKSEQVSLHFGVPQGSILGPLLFIIYINDFSGNVPVDKCLLFADDTVLFVGSKDSMDVLERSSAALDFAGGWFTDNRLVLNNAKSATMVFSMRDTVKLNDAETFRYLGFCLDSKLKWNFHVNYIANKLSKTIFLLRSLSFSISPEVIKTAYFSLFHAVMAYGILIWGHCPSRHRIFSLQRRAIRTMCGLPFRADCRGAFVRLKILTFTCQYILDCIIYIKSNIDDYATNSYFHSYDTRKKENLSVKYARLHNTQRNSSYLGVKFYNALPHGIKNLKIQDLKFNLKKTLFGTGLLHRR